MEFVFRRSYQGPLKAVILDWAGTTVDYGSRAPAVAFVEIFKRQGVALTLEEARGPMGMAKKDHIRELIRVGVIAQRWRDIRGHFPGEAEVEALYEAFIPLQLEILAQYADLIPGTRQAVDEFRQQGLKIGSNTGYNREMTNILLTAAKEQGYEPDSTVCASEVPAGRPEPWMALQNAREMRVYPMEAVVKIDDTIAGIEEGLNAGMWTIGLTKTGNEIGLSEAEVDDLAPEILQTRLAQASQRLAQAGAHYVCDGIWEVVYILDEIVARLTQGDRP
jgi:phosphonoacetaldehyde hydrolase